MTRKDLQELSRLRLREAEALYKARLYDGCVYLAGYAVELALKARICRVLRVNEYPSGDLGKAFEVHSLNQLKVLAGLSPDIDVGKNKELFDNWSKAITWTPEQRYESPGKYSAGEARAVLDSDSQAEWSVHVALKTLVANPPPLVKAGGGVSPGNERATAGIRPRHAGSLRCLAGQMESGSKCAVDRP